MNLHDFLATTPPPRDPKLASPEVVATQRKFVGGAAVLDYLVSGLALVASLAIALTADDLASAWPGILFAWMLAAPFFGLSRLIRRRNRRILVDGEFVRGKIVAEREATRRYRGGGVVRGVELDVEYRRSSGELWRFVHFVPDATRGPEDVLDGEVPLLLHPTQARSTWVVRGADLQLALLPQPVR